MANIVKFKFKNGDYYEGEILNKKLHGKGKYTWVSGDIYEGDWVENKRHGYGKQIYINGEIYEGGWSNNQRHGKGVLTYKNGTIEDVEYINGVKQEILELESVDLVEDAPEEVMEDEFEGYEYIYYDDGSLYFGEVKTEIDEYGDEYKIKHGRGTIVGCHYINQCYAEEADFVDDELVSDGIVKQYLVYWNSDFSMYIQDAHQKIYLKNGEEIKVEPFEEKKKKTLYQKLSLDDGEYVGETYNGLRHGNGVFKSTNGYTYEGEYKYDFMHGKGKITYDNNESYEGEFRAGMFHGRGIYDYGDGGFFEGNFIRGLKEGAGFYYEVDRKNHCVSYRTNYHNGERDGKCLVYECDNYRYGKKNNWKESSVEFWRNGDLLASTNEFFAYYHVRDYADYLYEWYTDMNADGSNLTNLTKYFYGTLATAKEYAFHKEVTYEAGNWKHIYDEMEKAFNEGKYWKILECLIFGFENPDYEFSSLADAFEMLDLFKRKGFLDNKHNKQTFDDYMVALLRLFYEHCLGFQLYDDMLEYDSLLPFMAAGFGRYSKDSRYIWGARKMYKHYVDGKVSFIIFLYELREIDDIKEMIKIIFATHYLVQDLHDEAYNAFINDDYYRVGCWIKR